MGRQKSAWYMNINVLWQVARCLPIKIWNLRLQNESRRTQWPRGLRRRSAAAGLLRLWVESHRTHGCLSVESVVCCQVEVSATSWSLVQVSPTDCGASLCVIYKPREEGGLGPLGAVTSKTNKQANCASHMILPDSICQFYPSVVQASAALVNTLGGFVRKQV
jgi:hypothetical protein